MALPYSGRKEFLALKLGSTEYGKQVVTPKKKMTFVLIKLIHKGPSLKN